MAYIGKTPTIGNFQVWGCMLEIRVLFKSLSNLLLFLLKLTKKKEFKFFILSKYLDKAIHL